jgi:hypothetical protein
LNRKTPSVIKITYAKQGTKVEMTYDDKSVEEKFNHQRIEPFLGHGTQMFISLIH